MTNRLRLAIVFAVLAAGAPALAQTTTTDAFDSRWTPYLGCWEIAQEYLGQQSVPVAPGLMVCVRPSGTSSVAITTTLNGKNVLEQTIVADGTAQPLSQADCEGTQASEWSRDGERLFTLADLTCAGRPTRIVSGITLIATGQWVDAQATAIDGDDHDVRLRKYRRTSDQLGRGSALASAQQSSMSVDDVIEASAKVPAPALEAVLAEAGGRFSLNSRTLKQLADAGVSPSVIDLMVGQAYPDRVGVERPSTYPSTSVFGSGAAWRGSGTSVFLGSSAYASPIYDPFYHSYYYYSPFAYPYYWGSHYYPYRYGYRLGYRNYYNNYYYGYPGSVYVPANPGSRATSIARPGSPDSRGGDGVVVNGRGYTRARPNSGSGDSSSATPATRTTTAGGGTRSVSSGSSSDSGSSSSSSSSSSSASSGGSASGSGYSRGGSSSGASGGGGRTAQPR